MCSRSLNIKSGSANQFQTFPCVTVTCWVSRRAEMWEMKLRLCPRCPSSSSTPWSCVGWLSEVMALWFILFQLPLFTLCLSFVSSFQVPLNFSKRPIKNCSWKVRNYSFVRDTRLLPASTNYYLSGAPTVRCLTNHSLQPLTFLPALPLLLSLTLCTDEVQIAKRGSQRLDGERRNTR